MTKEVAKKTLNAILMSSKSKSDKEALDLAIKALEQIEIWNATTKDRQIIAPKGTFRKIWEDEQQPTLDIRQRERQLEMEYQHGYDKGWEEGRKALEQQQKTGHWIDADDGYPFNAICSSCNRLNHLYGNYCKHCGAKMVEPQESEDEEE